MEVTVPPVTSKYWDRCKGLAPLRQLRALYRFMHGNPFHPRRREQMVHRLLAEWSYRANRRLLLRRLRDAGRGRPVVVISQVVHLGDIVACEPVVRQVRRANPEAFLVFALHRNYRELAESHPCIDHVLPLACVTEWVRFSARPLFDRVIDLNLHGRTCNTCGVPLKKPGGGNGVGFDNYFNYGSLLAAFSRSAGIAEPEGGPALHLGESVLRAVDLLQLPERYVCVHAQSNESFKDIDPALWPELIGHINRVWKLPVLEVGLQARAVTPGHRLNRSLCGRLSILESAEVIRRSVLFLGGDSGPAHLANAVGAFGIVVLGQYRGFRSYLPFSGDYAAGARCELVCHDGPVAGVPASRITAAIDRRMRALSRPSEGAITA